MKLLMLAIFAIVSAGSFAAQSRDLPSGYLLLGPGKVEQGIDGDVVFQMKEAAARAIEMFIPTKYSNAYEGPESMNRLTTMLRELRTIDVATETWEQSVLSPCKGQDTYAYVSIKIPNLLVVCPRVSSLLNEDDLGMVMQLLVHESYHMYTAKKYGIDHLHSKADWIKEEGEATIYELQIISSVNYLAGNGGCVFQQSYAGVDSDIQNYLKEQDYWIPPICKAKKRRR